MKKLKLILGAVEKKVPLVRRVRVAHKRAARRRKLQEDTTLFIGGTSPVLPVKKKQKVA